MTINLSTIEERIKDMIQQYPEIGKLKNKKYLIWFYWSKYDGLKGDLSYDHFKSMTDVESISRARRYVLKKMKQKDIMSYEMQSDFRQHYTGR